VILESYLSIDSIQQPDVPELLLLDATALSPEQAATQILQHVEKYVNGSCLQPRNTLVSDDDLQANDKPSFAECRHSMNLDLGNMIEYRPSPLVRTGLQNLAGSFLPNSSASAIMATYSMSAKNLAQRTWALLRFQRRVLIS
jgi:hypothetical protein